MAKENLKKVTSDNSARSAYIPTGGIRETITGIGCIAANGDILPPAFIIKGEYLLEQCFQKRIQEFTISLQPRQNTFPVISDPNGLNYSISSQKGIQKDEFRLLLFDGHGSHITYDFLCFCEQNQTIPFCFIPHTRHFAQPLDGKRFLQYKRQFRRITIGYPRGEEEHQTKRDFFREISTPRNNASKARIIRNAFKDTGLIALH
jgi:hypothetical protein